MSRNRRFITEGNRLGEFGERLIYAHARQLFGEPVQRINRRGFPIDLEGATVVIEVKTVRADREAKIRGSGESTRAKDDYARLTGKRPVSVLVRLHAAEAWVFVKGGFGAYREGGMTHVVTYPVDPREIDALVHAQP